MDIFFSPLPPAPLPLLKKTAKTNEVWSLLIGAPSQTRIPDDQEYGPTWKLCLRGPATCLDAINHLISLVYNIYLYFPLGLCVSATVNVLILCIERSQLRLPVCVLVQPASS
ncbi:hypothetical protein ABZP36_019778 [Zizania latifolia]